MRHGAQRAVGWGLGVLLGLSGGCGPSQNGAATSTERGSRGDALITRNETLYAVADTHCMEGTPTTSYGALPTLEVDGSPQAEAYLRFAIPRFSGTLTTARLRLHALDSSLDGPSVRNPPGVWNWSEQTTWNTRPMWSGSWVVADVGPILRGTWVEWDVTEAINLQRNTFDAFLKADGPDGAMFASSEHEDPALRPRLVLTIESTQDHPPPSVAPLPVSGAPVAFAPSADAFVSSDAPGASSGGASVLLRVGNSPQREAHLRFSLQGLTESVQRAVLRLKVGNDGSANGPSVFETRGAWSEGSVTWSSRPSRVGSAVDRVPVLAPAGFVDYDVTNLVRGNGEVALGLYGNSTDEVGFHSREAGTLHPELLVWTGASRSEPTDACMTRQELLTRTFVPLHDTYVVQSSPTTVFHREASLGVDGWPHAESYLDFDVQLGSRPVRRVLLRLYALDASGNGPRLFKAQPFEGATTDWNHRPAIAANVLGDLGAVSRDQWVEFDVTDAVTTSGRHAFALQPDAQEGLRFASLEAQKRGLLAVAPQLLVLSESEEFCSYRGGPSPSGTVAWVTQSRGLTAERSRHVAPALGGGYASLSAVEPAQATPSLFEQTDVVVLHRADGGAVWSREFAQAGVEFRKVVVTSEGNVLAAGEYFGAPDLGKGPLPWGRGMFVVRLGPSGQVEWTRGYIAWFETPNVFYENPMEVLDLATDAHGSAVLVGTFWGYTNFGAGVVYSGKSYPTEGQSPNSFVLKLHSDGTLRWSRLLVAATDRGTLASSVAVDSEENISVGGWVGRDTDFGVGPMFVNGLFTARWGVSGNLLWSRVFPVSHGDIQAVRTLPDGGVVFVGAFDGNLTFAGHTYSSQEPDDAVDGPRDALLGRLGPMGTEEGLRHFQSDAAVSLAFQDLAVDAAGRLVTSQSGWADLLGMGPVGLPEGQAPNRPTLASFESTLETRWVRVLEPLHSGLHLAPVEDGIIATGDLASPFELDGTWYTPTSRRSDLVHMKFRP
ncbi:CBM96 family carbohydrate-binding protein [Myxococcus landrumensis]|uniref:DNRLRE domain-containing protein n=1 Tax=Myxococcus landrumensis TaxID=2813577 RepID=A0ABX7N9R4_9BACT|nr:DNRLRE domain-containing protein [Myxococcus landrumus]QSQ15216.1 DNRLRE domain-containing protein [Myxococcus landrumus]